MFASKKTAGSVFLVTSILSGLAGGCTNAPAQPGSPGTAAELSAADWCQSVCARVLSCDSSTDKSVCVDKCTNKNSAIVPRLRADVVNSALGCFDAKDCASVLDGSAWPACMATATADMAPSQAAQQLCSDWGNAAPACNTTVDQGKCLNLAKVYNDAALADADTCTKNACSSMVDCLNAALP
jgi:hypothetical protein